MEKFQSLSNEDMISQLPEALILQILSLLPTKDVVAMSVLSKRWKHLWTIVPNLEFTYYGTTDNDLEVFSDNVCKSLLLRQAPVLQSLHLHVNFKKRTSIAIGILVGIALGLHLRKLVLEVYCGEGSFRFPRSLLNSQTLETLENKAACGSIVLDVPFPLEYLELCTYKADCLNLLTLMLDTCPNLQVLKLIGPWFKRYDPRKKWNQPKNVPECLLLHLETFAWTAYEGRPEDEKEVARYILKNASRLKKAVFSELDEINSEERVLELVEELESMVRGSNSCQLVFK